MSRTGNTFDRPVTVGTCYMLKVEPHLVDGPRLHARSTGSLQPGNTSSLGWLRLICGQKRGPPGFGEMKFVGPGSIRRRYTLQEMLT